MSHHTGKDPACPVCGAAIEAEPVLCARCDTPHHADCWGYAGRCAVYACQGVAVVGNVPIPVVPGASSAVVPVPAAGTTALTLRESAARVPPIVRAPRLDDDSVELNWVVDETGAWLGARSQAITVAPGERIVMLPQIAVPSQISPQALGRWMLKCSAVFAALGACVVVMPPTAVGFAWAMFVVSGWFLKVQVEQSYFRASEQRAWLGLTSKGLWLHGFNAGRPWEMLIESDAAPTGVSLARAYEDGFEDASRTLITYRLVLDWKRKDHTKKYPLPAVELAVPLQMPETVEARRPMLEQLVARRELGRHIAALLKVPFNEGVSRS